jgi:hypothetical protein
MTSDISDHIQRRATSELQSYDVQGLSITAQRQLILLSGREISTRKMADVWREAQEERNCMSVEESGRRAEEAGQRRENCEAGEKLTRYNGYQQAVNVFHGAKLAQQKTAEDVRRLVERLKR